MSEKQKPGAVDKINGVPHIYTGSAWVAKDQIVEFIMDGVRITGRVMGWIPSLSVVIRYSTLEGDKDCSRLPGHILAVYNKPALASERTANGTIMDSGVYKIKHGEETYYAVNSKNNYNLPETTIPQSED